MGKKSPSAPAAPDPAVTTAAQTAGNKETAYWNAILNNVNQYTPYGSIEYTDSSNGVYNAGQAPKFTSTIKLSPDEQKKLDLSNQGEIALSTLGNEQLGRIRDSVATPYSFDGMPEVFNDQGNAQTAGQEAILSRLNPKFAQDEEALRTRLINQGIGQGSDAYTKEFDTLNQAKNDARQQAVLGGQSYANALLNDSLTRRNQAIQEYTTTRNAPLNEFNAFTTGTQVQNPTFQSSGNGGAQAADYQGAANTAYQGALNNYNSKVASNNSATSGLFGLGGAALSGYLGGSGGSLLSSLFR